MEDIEIWKDVVGYEGLYQISNFGRVKSLPRKRKLKNNCFYISKEKIRSLQIDKHGYYVVQLKNNGIHKEIKVHRLVAEAFIPNPLNKKEVNHIDCNPKNNNENNLNWMTHKENMDYMNALGRNKRTKQWNNRRNKSLSKYYKKVIGTNLLTGNKIIFNSINESKKYGFNPSDICNCCKGNRKTAKGFIWNYYS